MTEVRLSGYALHAGVVTSVTLTRHDGPITFARGNTRAELASLRVARTDFGVALRDDHGFEVDLVEHLLAAIGGLGIGAEVLATLEGPELPILDGGARAFVDALARLEIPRASRRWAIQKAGKVEWKDSVYEFDVLEGIEIVVDAEFPRPVGRQRASWNGDPRRFSDEIAPARTFGFAMDAEALWRNGRAQLARLASKTSGPANDAFTRAVLVLDENGIKSDTGNPASVLPDELARHKLLDLVGDLTLHGGPPRGRIRALRPGHTATHRIIGEAIALGILSRP